MMLDIRFQPLFANAFILINMEHPLLQLYSLGDGIASF